MIPKKNAAYLSSVTSPRALKWTFNFFQLCSIINHTNWNFAGPTLSYSAPRSSWQQNELSHMMIGILVCEISTKFQVRFSKMRCSRFSWKLVKWHILVRSIQNCHKIKRTSSAKRWWKFLCLRGDQRSNFWKVKTSSIASALNVSSRCIFRCYVFMMEFSQYSF